MRRPVEKPYFAIREPEGEQDRPTHEEIEMRAYQIYIDHGRADGNDLADWLQAELELLTNQANPATMTRKAAA